MLRLIAIGVFLFSYGAFAGGSRYPSDSPQPAPALDLSLQVLEPIVFENPHPQRMYITRDFRGAGPSDLGPTCQEGENRELGPGCRFSFEVEPLSSVTMPPGVLQIAPPPQGSSWVFFRHDQSAQNRRIAMQCFKRFRHCSVSGPYFYDHWYSPSQLTPAIISSAFDGKVIMLTNGERRF